MTHVNDPGGQMTIQEIAENAEVAGKCDSAAHSDSFESASEAEATDLVSADEYDVWSEADGINDRVRGYGVEDALTRWALANLPVNEGMFVYAQNTTAWGFSYPLYFVSRGAADVEVELRECDV